MKTTVYESDFIDAFKALRPDNFSYQGLRVLFEMLTEYEEASDQELELDVIAICCDYNELSIDDFFDAYDLELDKHMTDERDAIECYLQHYGGDYRWCESGGEWTIVFWDAF